MIDASIIAYVVENADGLTELQRKGVEQDDFVDEYRTIWKHLCKARAEHDSVPSADTLITRFPDLQLPTVEKRDIPHLLSQLKKRRKYIEFLTALNDAASEATDYDKVDEVIQDLQSNINSIAFKNGQGSHLVDLFSKDVNRRIVKELHKRRSGRGVGFPSGLKRFDSTAGGLQPKKMVTIIGRTGVGKSWIDLLFVCKAVMDGRRVILYPLEMSLEETAFRLYTIFSQEMFGAKRVLKNYDLTTGKVTKQKITRFLSALEDRFSGQLYVADVSSLADPYTNERIEAEVDLHRPDMFWVDYLTLLKAPKSGPDEESWQSVKKLSQGIKNTAMRRNTVGGASAQVSREAIRARVFLPRLEHISFGDSIGQDSDQVFTINKKGPYLYYALVKNRGGAEIPPTRVKFNVNEGIIAEAEHSDDEEEEDEVG